MRIICFLLIGFILTACSQADVTNQKDEVEPNTENGNSDVEETKIVEESQNEVGLNVIGKWLVTYNDGYTADLEITEIKGTDVLGVYHSQSGDKNMMGSFSDNKLNLRIYESDESIVEFVNYQLGLPTSVTEEDKQKIINDIHKEFQGELYSEMELQLDSQLTNQMSGEFKGFNVGVDLSNLEVTNTDIDERLLTVILEKTF